MAKKLLITLLVQSSPHPRIPYQPAISLPLLNLSHTLFFYSLHAR